MKLYTSRKILVELSQSELHTLNCALNTAAVRMREQNWPENRIREVDKLWLDTYEIQKSFPF